MSTEFTSQMTDEMGFVRWGQRTTDGTRTAFEFGTVTNFERVCAMMRMGDSFQPQGMTMAGDPSTVEDMEQAMVDGRVTFDEFAVTVAVGSGEAARFSLEG